MEVQHDTEGQRFFMPVGDGDAVLSYSMFSDDIIDLQHTEVPRSARGRGVADALIRAALAYARERALHVIVTCPFAQRWLRKHPDERPTGTVDRST